MFGKKDSQPSSQSNSPRMNASINSLVKGTNVDGQIISENDIRIDGTLKGNLTCKAKVILGPTGFIEGEINCTSAILEGRLEGIIHVRELLTVRQSAVVSGDVNTQKLIVDAGAEFNVTCKMGDSITNYSAPNPAKTGEAKGTTKQQS